MEHNTEHNEHDTTELHENPLYRRPWWRRRLRLVAACVAVALPVVGLATYGIAGASDGDDDPVETVEDCGEPTPEDVAATNEDEDALAAYLDERGIHHTREPDEDGVRWVAWDETDEAANDAVDEFWVERYPTPPEEVDAMNAEQDDLAAYLDAHGIRYTRKTSSDGVSRVDWDMTDDAAGGVVAQFYAERYPMPPLPDEQIETVSCVGMVEVGPG
jgi:hypothetical protein